MEITRREGQEKGREGGSAWVSCLRYHRSIGLDDRLLHWRPSPSPSSVVGCAVEATAPSLLLLLSSLCLQHLRCLALFRSPSAFSSKNRRSLLRLARPTAEWNTARSNLLRCRRQCTEDSCRSDKAPSFCPWRKNKKYLYKRGKKKEERSKEIEEKER